jgi:predicted transposase/invertase (TIGR01784 family)
MSAESAMKAAIEYCLGQGILVRELGENSSEVINMLLAEWSWDDAKEVWQEEAREDGREEGRRETAKNLKAMGLSAEQIAAATGLSPVEIARL